MNVLRSVKHFWRNIQKNRI